jgi:RNA polymerase sigma factor (sigma-70 family)
MPDEDPDLFLVQALQAGNDLALTTLMQRHQQRIFHFIFRHVNHEADARELAQETFVRAYFNITRFQPRSRFSTWLFQIALNLCRDHVRSKSWRNRQATDSLTNSPGDHDEQREWDVADSKINPAEQLEQTEQRILFQQSLEQLPLELKGPLFLTAVDDYSHQEAAKMLGITPKAIESKVYRAKKMLTKILSRKDQV